MQREVKGRLRCWREKPGLDGEADRTGTLLPPLQGKPDNGGNRYHPVKYGGSSGGGEGRCSASPGMEKSVFQSVFTMKKEFSAAFRRSHIFGRDSGRVMVSVSDEIMKLGKKEEL